MSNDRPNDKNSTARIPLSLKTFGENSSSMEWKSPDSYTKVIPDRKRTTNRRENMFTQRIIGDYVITPCKNAFNENTSWWLSKRDYTIAMYAFTADTEREVEYQMEHIDSYINSFELLLNRH